MRTVGGGGGSEEMGRGWEDRGSKVNVQRGGGRRDSLVRKVHGEGGGRDKS